MLVEIHIIFVVLLIWMVGRFLDGRGHHSPTALFVLKATWGVKAWWLLPITLQRRQVGSLHRAPRVPRRWFTSTTTWPPRIGMSLEQVAVSGMPPPDQDLPKVVIIAGPTGTGKSDVAALICEMLRGMIVSADSVQVYQNVQIGANKPSRETLQQTPHILLDLVNHTTPSTYSAAEWRRDAIFAIQQLASPHQETFPFLSSDELESLSEQTTREDQRRQKLISATIQEAKNLRNKLDQKFQGDHLVCKGTDDDETKKSSSYMPVVVGGTMMYVNWLVHGRPDAVRPTGDAVQQAEQVMTQYIPTDDWLGATHYVSEQGTVFQQQVQKLSPHDWYRLRRILENAITVKASSTTIPIEQVYSGIRKNGLSTLGYDVRSFFLCPDDRMKHTKIVDLRCEQMIVRGLLEETTNLKINNEMPDMVSRAIGYRQSIEYLERENPTGNDVDSFLDYVAKFAAATRQYSQQQMKWFRREKEFMFVPVPLNEDDPQRRIQLVADKLIKYINMSKEEYDAELQSPLSESQNVRNNNVAQAKGMKVYQLEKQILRNKSPELLDALSVADTCTRRFQAETQKRRIEHTDTTVLDEGDDDNIDQRLQNKTSNIVSSNDA